MDNFEAIIGYDSIKTELKRIADVLNNAEKYAKLGVTQPNGLLLYGEPGVGKTTMAKCLLSSLDRKVFVCRKTKSDGDFVDEISKTFERAKVEAPSVVFLDDFDKFANDDSNHRDAEEYVAVQSNIDNVKGTRVFVIATANDIGKLPRSLLRAGRFDKSIEIKAPQGDDAKKIIEYYLSQKKFVANVDTCEIARIMNGRSCAELETVINEAGICAGFSGKDKIEMDDIVRACLRVIFDAPECEDRFGEEAKMRIAFHEAGHAVVSEILEEGSVNLVSVDSYGGESGGITSSNQSADYMTSSSYMENRIIVLLGGKAATELVFGEADPGAGNDIGRAHSIATRLVDDYAGYGFNYYLSSRYENSGDTLRDKERAVALEMERYYRMAKKILINNRAFLDNVAAKLKEKRTLLGSEIRAIRSACIAVA